MKVALFANTGWYLYNFRRPLLERLRRDGHEVLALAPPDRYLDALAEAGFATHAVPMSRRFQGLGHERRALRFLRTLLKEERPDLLHNFTLKSIVYGSEAARFDGGPALVNAVAGLGFVFSSPRPAARALRPPLTLLLKRALLGEGRAVILQNPDDQRALPFLRRATVEVIRGSGVETRRFTAAPDRDPGAVLMATRLLAGKGVDDFCAAAGALRETHPTARFLLAGAADAGNPDSLDDAALAALPGVTAVERLGHVDDMVSLLGSASVLAFPSRYGEGVPRILVEGAAAGLALVATDIPGCREIVRHEQTGLLVRPGDPAGLAGALRRLLDEPALARRLGAEAQRVAREEFDEAVVNEATLNLYQRVLADEPQPRGRS